MVVVQFGSVSPPAGAANTVIADSKFEIDGNYKDDSGPGDPLDWETAPANTTRFKPPELAASTKDDAFVQGSHEVPQSSWNCANAKAPGKDDIVNGGIFFRRINGDQYAYVYYFRKEITGDAHMDFEFNASSAAASPGCPNVSMRSVGDVLIAFDTANGGKTISVVPYLWDGTAFQPPQASTNFQDYVAGAVNIPDTILRTNPDNGGAGSFGEAVINLTKTIGDVRCGEFSGAYMKTRSSTSADASLQDLTARKSIDPDNCPKSSLDKGVRNTTKTPSAGFTHTATASPGDTLQYQLSYANTGATANNVELTDTLEAHQTLVASSCVAPACTTTTDASGAVTLHWLLGNVGPTGSTPRTVTFSVTLDSTFPAGTTTVSNTGHYKTDQEGTHDSNTTTVTVNAAPIDNTTKGVRDVTSGATAFTSSTDAKPGDTLEYQLGYRNSGNANATHVVLGDPIPAHTTFVSCSDSCTQTKDANNKVTAVSWSLGTVAPSAAPILRTFQVVLDTTGFTQGATVQVTNQAKTCTDQNGTACSSSTVVIVNVKTPKVDLVKSVRNVSTNGQFANSATASPGNTLEYQLVATNNGTATATSVVVGDVIQQYQTYVSCNPNTCTTVGAPVTSLSWPSVTLAPGASATFTFRVSLASTFPNGTTTVKDTATVVSDQEPSKNSNETSTNVSAAPVDSPTKGARNATTNASGSFTTTVSASPGDVIEYQLTYTNTGNAPATGVVLKDGIPAHSTFLSCSDTCTKTPATGTVTQVSWSVGTVQPNTPVSRTFKVTLDTTGFTPGTTTAVKNVAVVCTTENPACTTTPEVTVNVLSPKSSLVKAVRNATVNPTGTYAPTATAQPGDVIEYQLTYSNAGPGKATNVVISDPIPAGSTYLSCNPACSTAGTSPVTSVSWSIGTVAAGGQAVVTFKVTLNSSFPSGTSQVKNTGSVSTAEEGSTPSNEVVVTVTALPNLTLLKSSNANAVVIVGDQITYTITAGNTGKAPATSSVITETVPAGTTYLSCTNSCTVSGSTVTWSIGTVNPGDVKSVTMTVSVNSTAGCTICNTATVKSPDQGNSTPVSSNQVCANAQPGDNPAGAHASGSGQAASVQADLSVPPLLPLVIDQHLGVTSSAQSGVGGDSHDAEVLGVTVPPTGTTVLLKADVLRSTSSSVVSASPARARAVSTSETLGVKVLNSLVTADVVQGVSQSTAGPDSSSISSAGSTFKNLHVNGLALNDVAPNTHISLGDITGLGLGVNVWLREEVGSTSGPAATVLSGGTYTADLTVNMIHVHVDDGNLLKGGKQPIDIIVSQAVSHADFPQTRVCDSVPTRNVSGSAEFAGVWLLDPGILDVHLNEVGIPERGGQQRSQVDQPDVTDTGSLLDAHAIDTFASGGFDATTSQSYDYASAANVCITLVGPSCDISAVAVRSVSSSTANAAGRSSADSYGSDATKLVSVNIGGLILPNALMLPDTPPPNTTITIPGLATIVLNEQICDNGGTLANHCSDGTLAGHTGLTVRAIHVIVTNPLATPSGTLTEVIVAEAHSDATWK